MKTVAEAVHYAHKHGVLHRDLKPSNVLIDANDQPRVTDFGLAKRLPDQSESQNQKAESRNPKSEMELTSSGQLVGSPSYVPPEQAATRWGKVSRRSDVYGLGAVLYHLLTGRPPFQAATITDTLEQVFTAEPIAPRALNPSLPRDLETICLKCLEKEPDKRYPTAQALAEELGRYLEGQPVLARPIGPVGRGWRWCRRNPRLALLSGACALSVLLGFTGILWQWSTAEAERARAEAGELTALRNAYAADISAVQRALEEGDLNKAWELLNRYRPRGKSEIRNQKSEIDLRGWEWRHLWERCQSDERLALCQHSNAIGAVAFTPDGVWLAVRQSEVGVELWDWSTGRKAGELPSRGGALVMAISPHGNLLACGDRDEGGQPLLSLWDVTTQRRVAALWQPAPVTALDFSPDGKLLATFNYDATVRLWDVESGLLITHLPAAQPFSWFVNSIRFAPDGMTLAIGEDDGRVRLVKWQSGGELTIPAPSDSGVSALAFSPDGRLLASGYGWADGTIRLWDVATGMPQGELEGHRGRVARLVFAPDGRTLISASDDQTIRLWNLDERSEAHRLQGHTNEVWGLALTPDGRTLASGGRDGVVRIWDATRKPGERAHAVLPLRLSPYGSPFTPDSQRLITASRGAPVTVWDVATGSQVEELVALGTNNIGIALAPDGRLLAVGNWSGTIRIWDRANRQVVTNFAAHRWPIYILRFSGDGRWLFSVAVDVSQAGFPAVGQLWDVASWQQMPLRPLEPLEVRCVSWSPDGGFLAFGYRDGTVELADSATGRLRAQFTSPIGYVAGVAFSADGRRLAAGGLNGVVRIWDVPSRREVVTFRAHPNRVNSLAFSPDGRRLATGTGLADEVVRLWDLASQRDLISLRGRGTYTWDVAFAPDGNTLVASSWHGIIEIWRAPTFEEIESRENDQRTH